MNGKSAWQASTAHVELKPAAKFTRTSSMMSRYSSWSVMRGWCRPMYRSRFWRRSLSVPTSTTHGSTRLRGAGGAGHAVQGLNARG